MTERLVAVLLAFAVPVHAEETGPTLEGLDRRLQALERRLPPVADIPAGAFPRVVEATIQSVKGDFAGGTTKASEQMLRARLLPAHEVVSFADAPSATVVARALAAIKTDIAGAEAGFLVAPLLLAGRDTAPFAWTVTLAALEGGRTRFGTGLVYAPPWNPDDYADVGLSACQFGPEEEAALRAALARLEAAFRATCGALLEAIGKPPADEDGGGALLGWQDAQSACGLAPAGEARRVRGLPFTAQNFGDQILRTRARLKNNPDALRDFELRLAVIEAPLAKLESFAPPHPDACIKDEQLDHALEEAAWEHFHFKIGAQLFGEAFPAVWGHNAEPDGDPPLPSGEFAKGEGRIDVEMGTGRWNFRLGTGLSSSRPGVADQFGWSLTPTIGYSHVLGIMGGGESFFEKGKLVPHVAAGGLVQIDIALTRPADQIHQVNAFSTILYLDFRFTEELIARIGIPLTAKLVTSPEIEGVRPRLTALQWSLPVFVTTALKL